MENNNVGNNFLEFQKQFSKSEFHRDIKKVVTEEDSNRDIAYDIWNREVILLSKWKYENQYSWIWLF